MDFYFFVLFSVFFFLFVRLFVLSERELWDVREGGKRERERERERESVERERDKTLVLPLSLYFSLEENPQNARFFANRDDDDDDDDAMKQTRDESTF